MQLRCLPEVALLHTGSLTTGSNPFILGGLTSHFLRLQSSRTSRSLLGGELDLKRENFSFSPLSSIRVYLIPPSPHYIVCSVVISSSDFRKMQKSTYKLITALFQRSSALVALVVPLPFAAVYLLYIFVRVFVRCWLI